MGWDMTNHIFGRKGNNVVPSGLGERGSCPVVETTGYTTYPLRGIESQSVVQFSLYSCFCFFCCFWFPCVAWGLFFDCVAVRQCFSDKGGSGMRCGASCCGVPCGSWDPGFSGGRGNFSLYSCFCFLLLNSGSNKRCSFVAPLFAAGYGERYAKNSLRLNKILWQQDPEGIGSYSRWF